MKTNKIILAVKTFALFAFLTLSSTSCSSDTPTPAPLPPDGTIVGVAVANPNLTILVKALTKAGLVSKLQGAGPFTALAPTDQAFISAGLTAAVVDGYTAPADIENLKQILLNHVISGNVPAAALVDNTYIKASATGSASATNTLSMYVSKTAAGAVKFNGVSNVSTPNVSATNGIIHVVDAVIKLPTIVTHASANPAFATLLQLVTSPSQAAVATALTTNTTPLTVFAPTNAAFATATAVGGFANGASSAAITKVLQYHVVGGNITSNTLTEGAVVPTVATLMMTTTPQTLKVLLTAPLGPRLEDKATAPNNISKIIVVDVQCANGIIHAVDKVLQPVL
jgi:uncharacterized surface protein with fasciclin (FAS1) repeats